MPWAFPFLALKRFVCILDKPCLQANISLSAFADKPCLHNRGRLRVPWTFPPPTFEIADESADKSADKVCLDMCLTNLFKNADARAAKIVQNADKSCLPKLQTKFVYSRQGLSILELALWPLPKPTIVRAVFAPPAGTEPRRWLLMRLPVPGRNPLPRVCQCRVWLDLSSDAGPHRDSCNP